MINYLFNISNIEKPKLINLSKKGNSYDTSLIEIKLKNEGFVNIFTSYNTSFNQDSITYPQDFQMRALHSLI